MPQPWRDMTTEQDLPALPPLPMVHAEDLPGGGGNAGGHAITSIHLQPDEMHDMPESDVHAFGGEHNSILAPRRHDEGMASPGSDKGGQSSVRAGGDGAVAAGQGQGALRGGGESGPHGVGDGAAVTGQGNGAEPGDGGGHGGGHGTGNGTGNGANRQSTPTKRQGITCSASIMRQTKPDYPSSARRDGIEGTVLIHVALMRKAK